MICINEIWWWYKIKAGVIYHNGNNKVTLLKSKFSAKGWEANKCVIYKNIQMLLQYCNKFISKVKWKHSWHWDQEIQTNSSFEALGFGKISPSRSNFCRLSPLIVNKAAFRHSMLCSIEWTVSLSWSCTYSLEHPAITNKWIWVNG